MWYWLIRIIVQSLHDIVFFISVMINIQDTTGKAFSPCVFRANNRAHVIPILNFFIKYQNSKQNELDKQNEQRRFVTFLISKILLIRTR